MYETRRDLPPSEAEDAKRFWSAVGVRGFYTAEKHWSAFMADRVLASGARRVLEFGCNVGRNLKSIRDRRPEIELVGIDINADAVASGRQLWGLDLRVGDESWLQTVERDSFDVIFTISVFDHLPEPQPVLEAAARVAPLLLLLEPWVGEEGKIVRNVSADGTMVDTTPFSYSWDYGERLTRCGMVVAVEAYPLPETNLGPLYHLYTASRGSG